MSFLIGKGDFGHVFRDGNFVWKLVAPESVEPELKIAGVLSVVDPANKYTVYLLPESAREATKEEREIARQNNYLYKAPYAGVELFEVISSCINESTASKIFPEVMYIFADLAACVKLLHEHHIYHMDLTNTNVTIGNKGETRIIDFGRSIDTKNWDIKAIKNALRLSHPLWPAEIKYMFDDKWERAAFCDGTTDAQLKYLWPDMYQPELYKKEGDQPFMKILTELREKVFELSIDTVLSALDVYVLGKTMYEIYLYIRQFSQKRTKNDQFVNLIRDMLHPDLLQRPNIHQVHERLTRNVLPFVHRTLPSTLTYMLEKNPSI